MFTKGEFPSDSQKLKECLSYPCVPGPFSSLWSTDVIISILQKGKKSQLREERTCTQGIWLLLLPCQVILLSVENWPTNLFLVVEPTLLKSVHNIPGSTLMPINDSPHLHLSCLLPQQNKQAVSVGHSWGGKWHCCLVRQEDLGHSTHGFECYNSHGSMMY